MDVKPAAPAAGSGKPVARKSGVMDHFTKIRGNGVATNDALVAHRNIQCHEDADRSEEKRQKISNCRPHEDNSADQSSDTVEFDYAEAAFRIRQEWCRAALVKMIIMAALPFSIVERDGFREFSNQLESEFELPSVVEIAKDVMELFLAEKQKLKSLIASNSQRVCLTTGIWKSLRETDYLCVTAHFIDSEWKLQKKILSFCKVSDCKEVTIGKMLEVCLLDWGIEKVFTVTFDNESSNDESRCYMQRRVRDLNGCVLDGEFLNLQCCGSVINLIISEGFEDLNKSIASVRNAVKYIRSSPSGLQNFRECVQKEKIECKGLPVLDVPSWWSSTYLMLQCATRFQKAFKRLADEDEQFLSYCIDDEDGKKSIGPPSLDDWRNIEVFVRILKIFYDTSLKFNTLQVTSNTSFHELCEIQSKLIKWSQSQDHVLCDMARSMKVKYDTYLGSVNNINPLLFVSLVLDPRYKIEFLKYCFNELPDVALAAETTKNVEDILNRLYECYSTQDPNVTQTASSAVDKETDGGSLCMSGFRKWLKVNNCKYVKTEVDRYLSEPNEDMDSDEFDVLDWWKSNSSRYPIMSQIARDVLALPMSAIGCESAFNIKGRILDPFRSSLSESCPSILEALICTQSWLRTTPADPAEFTEYINDFQEDEDMFLRTIHTTFLFFIIIVLLSCFLTFSSPI